MTDTIKTTNDEQCVIDALNLKEHQEKKAVLLKVSQDVKAIHIQQELLQEDPEQLAQSCKDAADALKQEQESAAFLLKTSQKKHAKILKKTQSDHHQALDEKDQLISWVTGGYSVDTTKT